MRLEFLAGQRNLPLSLIHILYELESILVLDVGRYGFVKLQYYTPEYGFNDVITRCV